MCRIATWRRKHCRRSSVEGRCRRCWWSRRPCVERWCRQNETVGRRRYNVIRRRSESCDVTWFRHEKKICVKIIFSMLLLLKSRLLVVVTSLRRCHTVGDNVHCLKNMKFSFKITSVLIPSSYILNGLGAIHDAELPFWDDNFPIYKILLEINFSEILQ